ncbi:M20/M25/M40 family metallo-hydrolase [Actinomadura bangladeshensis]|uniref:M20/M25/M40 family metallo-hydrolase n=1 Tax=Actinomadura bangladeshensis TaxID=453573 RepID=A0A4R4P091_9ACTN|nr:M20/M25/M40 family metallo-hydrolase [Actinomadura bangladeshensis]
MALPALFLPAALPAAGAAPPRPDLAKLVTLKDVQAHLAAFQEIADYNGGNRAAGTPGYDVSVRYVVGRLRKAGLTPKVRTFTYPYWREKSEPVFARTAPSKKTFTREKDFLTFAYSGSGDVTAPVVAVDVPAKGEGTSGCEKDDFKGFKKGSIALVQRGGCGFAAKAARAKAAGASAAVVFNKPGEKGPINGTVSKPAALPVVGVTRELGAELVKAAKKGGLKLRVKTDTVHGKTSSANVVADTERGDAGNVVLVGAHLDSVPAGPGINDNGTGAAALLAIAGKIKDLGKGLHNRVRFAWWGAEEEGLRGSAHYVESLPAGERSKIALNINLDMLGSPNGTRGVYDGDHSTGGGTRAPAGSGAIEKMFRDYFEGRRLPTTESEFDGRSDYGPFVERGIPSGGIATGAEGVKTAAEAKTFGGRAGKAYDPCYHDKCDRLKNVDLKLLDTNTDGVAHVLQHLAGTTVAVNGGARLALPVVPSYEPLRQGPHLVR